MLRTNTCRREFFADLQCLQRTLKLNRLVSRFIKKKSLTGSKGRSKVKSLIMSVTQNIVN